MAQHYLSQSSTPFRNPRCTQGCVLTWLHDPRLGTQVRQVDIGLPTIDDGVGVLTRSFGSGSVGHGDLQGQGSALDLSLGATGRSPPPRFSRPGFPPPRLAAPGQPAAAEGAGRAPPAADNPRRGRIREQQAGREATGFALHLLFQ